MPGPAVHHIIATEVVKKLKTQLSPNFTPFLKQCENEFSSAYFLGSQGPDILFFNLRDAMQNDTLADLVHYYLDVVDFIEDIKDKIIAMIPQELKDAVAALDAAADRSAAISQIKDMTGKVKDTITLLTDLVNLKIEEFITDKVNLFDLLKNPIQDAQDPKTWWWFDTLHYRRTGKFAQTLLAQAPKGTLEHAYAIGYLTHFAADSVGHPFVNIISGGPYRTHAKRHKLIENHHDVWAYNKYYGGEFVQSKLWEKYTLNGSEKMLPDSLNNLILKSIRSVYFNADGHSLYGKEMTKDDLNEAYRLWLWWFKKSTDALDLPKPEAYSFTDEIAEVWNKFTENLEDIGEMITGSGSGSSGILGFFKALAAAILAPFLAAAAAADFLIGIAETAATAPIQFMLSLIYQELYNAYLNLHQALVLNAFAFPFNYQLSHYLVKHVYNASTKDILNHNALSLQNCYPTLEFKPAGLTCESHLIYPVPSSLLIEYDKSSGAPLSYYNSDVNRYIFGPLSLNSDLYKQLKEFVEKTGGDVESTTKQKFAWLRSITQKIELGCAVDFSSFLYKEYLNNVSLPDFNLDGDKGIAFKTWRRVGRYADVNNPAVVSSPVAANVLDINTDIISPSEEIL